VRFSDICIRDSTLHRCTTIRELIDFLDELALDADRAIGLKMSTGLDESKGALKRYVYSRLDSSSVHYYIYKKTDRLSGRAGYGYG